MSFPLTLSAPSFTLPKKRLRDLSGEHVHDLDVLTQDRRTEQLKIEIPPTSLLQDSWNSARSTTSIRGSPSSLFSAASEINSFFDDVPSITHSRSATSRLLDSWISTAAPVKGSPTSLPPAASEVDSLFSGVPSTHLPHLTRWNSACATTGSIQDSPISLFSAMSEVDSLFDDVQSAPSATSLPTISDQSVLYPALLTAPPIQGLYFDPSLCLPQQIAESVMDFCLDTYFQRPGVNQVMLFGRAPNLEESSLDAHSPNGESVILDTTDPTGLPTILINLLSTLSVLLKPFLPEPTYTLLFPSTPTQARQAIINLYIPGEGISPHIDLLKRYGDGIIGVSFGSSCVMRFDRAQSAPAGADQHRRHHGPQEQQEEQRNRWDLYLPERSVLVLTEAARYEWTHGIDKRTQDYVSGPEHEEGVDRMYLDDDRSTFTAGRWIERSVRLSVTFRWLLPGADVVGPPTSN